MTTLKTALKEVCYFELEDIPSEEVLSADDTLTFSAPFECKMKKLIRRADHPIRYWVVQAVACLLLTLLLSGCTVLAVSPEAREAFVGWVRDVYETTFVYRYTGPNQEISEGIFYAPTWIPEGYQEISRSESGPTRNIFYKNVEGDNAAFYYTADPEALTLYIEAEYAEEQNVQVKEYAATLYIGQRESQANVLVWTDTEASILFFISAHATSEDLIKMAESVEIAPTEYHPSWIPEGYMLYDKIKTNGRIMFIYKNQAGELLSMSYEQDEIGGVDHQYLDEGYVEKRVFVSGHPADLYLSTREGAFSELRWSDSEKGVSFIVTACLPEDDILHLAESMRAIPEVQVPHSLT